MMVYTHIPSKLCVINVYVHANAMRKYMCRKNVLCKFNWKPLSWFLTLFQFWGSFKDNFSCTRLYIGGIVVFLFYNILTRHLAHKNSIRLIAYYLFIYYPKSGLVIFKFNLLNCLVMLQMCLFEVKFSFNRNKRSLLLKAGTRWVMHLKKLSVLGYSRQQTVR